MPEDKLPIPQFAAKIKAKYPQYKDVNDTLLVEKILAKYPEYNTQVDWPPVKKKEPSKIGSLVGGAVGTSAHQSEEDKIAQSLKTVGVSSDKSPLQASDVSGYDPNDPVKSIYAPIRNRLAELRSKPVSESTAQDPVAKQRRSLEVSQALADKYALDRLPAFGNTNEALSFIYDKLDEGKLVPNKQLDMSRQPTLDDFTEESIKEAIPAGNETAELGVKKYLENRRVRESLANNNSLEEAAIDFGSKKSGLQAKQIEALGGNIPKSMKASLLVDFLNDENVSELAANDAGLTSKIQETVYNLPLTHPQAAIRYLSSVISDVREQGGYNNAILNLPSVSTNDEIVDKLVESGKLPVQYKNLYDDPAVKFYINSKLKTPGFLENAASGLEGGLKGVGKTTAELGGLTRGKDEELYKALDQEYNDFAFKPKGFLHNVSMVGGNIIGQVLPTAAMGNYLQAAKIVTNPAVANSIGIGIQTYGDYMQQARKDLPKESGVVQTGYALINTGIEMATENIVNDTELAKDLVKSYKPQIAQITKKFTNKEISEVAAKAKVQDVFENILQSAKDFGKKTVKISVGEANEEAASSILQNATNQVFGGEDKSVADIASDAFETWKTTLFGGLPLGAVGGITQLRNNRPASELMYQASGSPEKYISIVKENAATDPEYAKEAPKIISNIEHAASVRKNLDSREDLTYDQKRKFLVASLNEKRLQDKIDSTPDKSLAKEEEKQLNAVELEKDHIIDKEATNTKIVQDYFDLGDGYLGKSSREMLSVRDEEGNPTNKFDQSKVGEYLKFIAQQANNLDENWNQHEGKAPTVQAPKEIIELANERWAKEIEAAKPKIDQQRELDMGTEPVSESPSEVEEMSDSEIENRMMEIEDKGGDMKEFNRLEKEMEKRERATVFSVPLENVSAAVDALVKKDKEQPNGYGSFIERRDASETKAVAERYLKPKLISDAELKNDFKEAVMGNPDTWYADGLKLRESLKEAANRGIDTSEMVAEVEKEFVKDGYTSEDAKATVARKLSKIFEGSQKVETNESKFLPENRSPEAVEPSKPTEDWGKDVESTFNALSSLDKTNSDAISRLMDLIKNDYSVSSLAKKILDKAKMKFKAASDEEIDMIKNAKTPKDVLGIISKTTKDKNLKGVADLFLSLYDKIAPFIEFSLDIPRDRMGYPAGSDVTGSYGGGKIHVSPRAFWQRTNNYFESGLESGFKSILHEFTHAFTLDAYRNPKTKIEKEFKSYIDKAFYDLKKNSAFKESYGFKSPEEFMAEILTNPEFRYSAPIYKAGVWQRIVDFVAKMFGYKPNADLLSDKRFEKVKETVNYIFKTLPDIRAGKGKEIFYESNENLRKISDAYHKAKKDGSNPELVKAVEDLLGKPTEETPTEQAPPEPPVAEPPGEGGVPTDPMESGGITHAANEVRRKDRALPEYEKSAQSFEQWNNEAERLIKEGYNVDGLMDKIEAGHDPNPVENAIRKIYIATLDAEIAKNPTDELLAKQKRFIEIGDAANSRAGRNLVSLKGENSPLDTISDFYVAKMEANGVDVLTEKQKQEVKAQFEAVQKAKEVAEAKVKELEAKVAELEAAKKIKNTKRNNVGTRKTSEEYKTDRAKLRDELKAAKEEHLKWLKDNNIQTSGLGAKFFLTPKMAKVIGKIIASHVDEVGANLAEVTERVFNEIKDYFDGITQKDVHDIIAGEYAEKRPTKTQLQKDLRDIRDEAELMNKLDKLLAGEEPASERMKIERNQKIKDLRDRINSIKKGEKLPEDAQALKRSIEESRRKEKELRDRIENKDFETEEKQTGWVNNKELKRKYPELYGEALDALAAKEQAKLDFDIALEKDRLSKRSVTQKGIDIGRSLIATTKAIKSGIDDSAVMMQNIVAMAAHPRSAVKALREHALDALSEKRFRRYLTELHNSPIWDLIVKSGLDITDPKSLQEQNKEEIFDNNLLNKDIKIKGKRYNIGKYVTRPFERAFTSLGNAMRVNMFTRIAEREYANGRTFESDPTYYKDLAKVLNTETGRGKLHTQVERASQLVTAGIWSPRLMASRINMLGVSELAPLYGGKGYYAGLTPEIRKMAIADMVKFVGIGVAFMGWAALQGAEVDDDPESTSFGTIKVGNKRYNAWGGFTPYVKTIYQFYTGHRKINGVKQEYNRGTIIGRFFRSRLTPAAGTVTNLVTGKDYLGKPITVENELQDMVTPMSISGIVDGIKKDGAIGILTQGIPSFGGVGVSDERDFERKNRRSKPQKPVIQRPHRP